MKARKFCSSPILFSVLCFVLASLSGCASLEAPNQESLLSAAGFRSRTPSTPAQQTMFSRMTRYTVERRIRNGKVLYAYADTKTNTVYIGGEDEYQRYKQLGIQQSIAQDQLTASEINEEASLYNWGPNWGPWQPWW